MIRIVNFADGAQSDTAPTAEALAAADVSVTPSGNLTETNVQAALEGIYTNHIDNTSGEHGITGSFVGTTDTQTLSGKSFGQDLISDSNNTRDLGTVSNKWKNLRIFRN